MTYRVCPWCGRVGVSAPSEAEAPQPHADGSPCVCRHVTCASKRQAKADHGRYFDGQLHKWVCLGGCQLVTALAWARGARDGDYLVKYADFDRSDDVDWERGGFDDVELTEIERVLGARDLRLVADLDVGLYAAADGLAASD